MAVMREETFGPVLPVMRVADAEEALRVANDSPFGLSGSVWSRDVAKARAIARRLQTGSLCVNDALFNYFCVEAPLGGVKSSGLGLPPRPRRPPPVLPDGNHRRGPPAARAGSRRSSGRQLMFPYRSRTQRLLRRFMRWFY